MKKAILMMAMAWVLWEYNSPDGLLDSYRHPEGHWSLIDAFKTNEECSQWMEGPENTRLHDHIVELEQSNPDSGTLFLPTIGFNYIRYTDKKTGRQFELHCLPDAIDPRGPKERSK